MLRASSDATCRPASALHEALFFGWFLVACAREFATSVPFALCDARLRSRQASAQAEAEGRPRAEQRSTQLQPWRSVARKQKLRGTCPADLLATFCAQPAGVPCTNRPLRAKTPKQPRLWWKDADALTRIRPAPQLHPTRAGLQFRHFPAWRCRNASRVHNDGDTTLVQKKRGWLHSRDGKVPKRCNVDIALCVYFDNGFPNLQGAYVSAEFLGISVLQRARNSVCASHSDVWVEVFYLIAFSMISRCHSVIIVALIFMIASLCPTLADASILFYT